MMTAFPQIASLPSFFHAAVKLAFIASLSYQLYLPTRRWVSYTDALEPVIARHGHCKHQNL
jgi:hypothetical protein